MAADAIPDDLREALLLLAEADDYLTDGDSVERIDGDGSPDIAAWAQRVRALSTRYDADAIVREEAEHHIAALPPGPPPFTGDLPEAGPDG